MVAFGPVPTVPAHATNGNPLAPKRDLSVEAAHRGPAPPVPRAPRAAPKAQSAGALRKDSWSRRPVSGGGAPRPSEQRRPREESPFSQVCEHRRVASLSREVGAKENQCFEMGPRQRPSSVPRTDYSRGHVLGQGGSANVGIPWASAAVPQDVADGAGAAGLDLGGARPPRNPARRHTLRHERQEAEQALEWGPPAAVLAGHLDRDTDHSRVNALKRADEGAFEFLPGAARNAKPSSTGAGEGFHGRRNVLNREFASIQNINMPLPVGGFDAADAVPSYGRKAGLERANPAAFAGERGGQVLAT